MTERKVPTLDEINASLGGARRSKKKYQRHLPAISPAGYVHGKRCEVCGADRKVRVRPGSRVETLFGSRQVTFVCDQCGANLEDAPDGERQP